jgi:hypothetical protein
MQRSHVSNKKYQKEIFVRLSGITARIFSVDLQIVFEIMIYIVAPNENSCDRSPAVAILFLKANKSGENFVNTSQFRFPKSVEQPLFLAAAPAVNLRAAVEALIGHWRLELTPCTDSTSDCHVAYGVQRVGDNMAWAIKVSARKSRFEDGINFETQVTMDFGSGWIRAHVLIAADGFRTNPHQRWTTGKFPDSWQNTACDPDFIFTIAQSFDISRKAAAEKELANRACDRLRKQLGADGEGKFAQPNVDGSVFIRDNDAVVSLRVTTKDAGKAAAIMAIMNTEDIS